MNQESIKSPYANDLLPKTIGKDKLKEIAKLIGYDQVVVIGANKGKKAITVAAFEFPPEMLKEVLIGVAEELPSDLKDGDDIVL